MNKNKLTILKLSLGAMFASLSVILNLVFDIWLNLNTFGFPFYGIPLILAGIFLGPKYAVIIGIVADTVFGTIKGYYPWFVFSTIAWSVIPALLKANKNKIYWTFAILLTYLSATLLNTIAILLNFSRTAAFASFWLRVGLIVPFGIIISIISYHLYERLKESLPKEIIIKEKKKGYPIPEYLINIKTLKLVRYE